MVALQFQSNHCSQLLKFEDMILNLYDVWMLVRQNNLKESLKGYVIFQLHLKTIVKSGFNLSGYLFTSLCLFSSKFLFFCYYSFTAAQWENTKRKFILKQL